MGTGVWEYQLCCMLYAAPAPHPSAVLVKQVVRGGGWLALGLTVSYFVFRKIRIFAKQVTNLPSSDCFAQLVSHAVVKNTKEETANSSPCRYGGVRQTANECRSPPPPARPPRGDTLTNLMQGFTNTAWGGGGVTF